MDKLRIVSLNVRRLKNKIKRVAIFNYLKAEKFDIVCLQETHVSSNDATLWEKQWGGKIFYQKGTSNSRGEVVMFSKHFKGTTEVIVNQERMLVLSVKSEFFNFHVVNMYAPTGKHDKKNILQQA